MDLLQASFTAHNTVREKRPFTIYEIEVRSSSTIKWLVYKRYNDFHALHQELVKICSSKYRDQTALQLPHLPPKRLTRSLAVEFVEKRKTELQAYLSDLLRIRELVRSAPLLEFLSVPDSVRPMLSRNSSQPSEHRRTSTLDLKTSSHRRNQHAMTYEERRVRELIDSLQNLPNKVTAIRSFEKYFFSHRPRLSADLITLLLKGSDSDDNGLVQTCGDVKYSMVASIAALDLLCRLLDVERNKDAQLFCDAFTSLDSKVLRKLHLHRHVPNNRGGAAFQLVSILCERAPHWTLEKSLPDSWSRQEYLTWEQRKSNAANNLALVPDEAKDANKTSPSCNTLNFAPLAESAFDAMIKIAESDQGWKVVRDEKFTASQLVYRATPCQDTYIVRLACAIPHDAEAVFKLLLQEERRSEWDEKLHSGTVVEKLSDDADIVHEVYKSFSSPYEYRDFCLLRSWRSEVDGSFAIVYRSVVHSSLPDSKDEFTATLNPAGFFLTPCMMGDGDDGSVASTLLIWVAQMNKESVLVVTPDLLRESTELLQSFKNLTEILDRQKLSNVEAV